MNTEPMRPIGAVDWIRRLRVGEAWLVAGGFLGAGPNSAQPSAAGAEWRDTRVRIEAEPGLGTRLLQMLHMH
jgi:hypothetical protein